MSFSKDLLEQIKNRSSLSDLVSQHTEVKPSGRNLVALSPFQDEKTASFYIYDDDTRFKCFSSGKGGSIFDFVMETRGLSFPEAVKYLAERAGIEIPKDTRYQKTQTNTYSKLYEIYRISALIYHNNLLDESASKVAQSYLKKRGINSLVAKRFLIGYAPDEWEFLSAAIKKGIDSKSITTSLKVDEVDYLLLKAGLIKEKSDSSKGKTPYYDAFRGRVLFPIFKQDSKPIAFGGRIMKKDSKAPKYINSSESGIYEKRKVLYGYSQALSHIRKARHAVLVEGYFDVVSLVKKGIPEAVATCGTSLTPDHAALLSRVASQVTTVFDGDRAGRKAAGKCFENFLNSGCEVNIVFLDEGEDPDSLAQKHSEQELRNIFKVRERPALDVYLEQNFEDLSGVALGSPDELKRSEPAIRGKLAKQLVRHLNDVLNPVERDALISQAASRLDVSERSINELIEEKKKSKRYSGQAYNNSADNYGADNNQAQRFDNSYNRPSSRYEENKNPNWDITEKLQASKLDSRQTMIAYIRQLIVSVLCEPSLIPHVLSSTSLTKEGLLSQSLPAQVVTLLESIEGSDFAGLRYDMEKGDTEQRDIVSKILTKERFKPERFVTEALSQLRIGGDTANRFVKDIAATNERFSIKNDLQELRNVESKTKDASELEKIAQEKLLKKRSMKNIVKGV